MKTFKRATQLIKKLNCIFNPLTASTELRETKSFHEAFLNKTSTNSQTFHRSKSMFFVSFKAASVGNCVIFHF